MSGFKKEDGDLESLMPSLEALMLADDPVEEPYKSKYKARDMLQAWRSGKGAQEEEEEEARVAYRIGKIALETEENHEADKELHASVQWFVPGLKEAVDKMGGYGETWMMMMMMLVVLVMAVVVVTSAIVVIPLISCCGMPPFSFFVTCLSELKCPTSLPPRWSVRHLPTN